MTFPKFFEAATGHSPYCWQGRLANGEPFESDDPETQTGRPCSSMLIDIPTGLGKTAAVVMAWLWNRVALGREDWPRRLVYCLPMRTLVEQTRDEAREWIHSLIEVNQLPELHSEGRPRIVVLMGGESQDADEKEWDIYPEQNCILIGTQDMLLSRALNRGYGMSRYRWPMHFALLNNDALWVMDEVQLMGVGVETSAQLAGLRKKLNIAAECRTWWMSATLDPKQLKTVDFPEAPALARTRLETEDRANPEVIQRESSQKPIRRAETRLQSVTSKAIGIYSNELAEEVLARHREISEPDCALTLVIVNRVDRAQAIYQTISRLLSPDQCLLIHSRFRGHERATQSEKLTEFQRRGGIVVATQAIEAGVDLSARVLFTELAPWPSLVQRFGRANRKGEFNEAGGAHLFWVDINENTKGAELPYEVGEIKLARKLIERVKNASPEKLSAIAEEYDPELPVRPVIRRKDIEELFDTTPDLTGSDIDVSRYIRESEDTDVLVYWGSWPDRELPPANFAKATRLMLCRVSIHQFRGFLKQKFGKEKKAPRVFRWNPTLLKAIENKPDSGWERADFAIPGQTYLIDARTPGYSPVLGWLGDNKSKPLESEHLLEFPETSGETNDSEEPTFTGNWQNIYEHCTFVTREVVSLAMQFGFEKGILSALSDAARWHDAGKAHPVFQDMLRGLYEEMRAAGETDGLPDDPAKELWAKARGKEGGAVRYQRKIDDDKTVSARGFRHELASALLYRQHPQLAKTDRPSLAAYLIACHHGKVRVGLRSLPNETRPADERLFARGIWDGDIVPAGQEPPLLLPGIESPIKPTSLDLDCIQLGQGSWASDALRLLAEFGPFRLAFYETLLRAADGRVSGQNYGDPSQRVLSTHEDPGHYATHGGLSDTEKAMAEQIAAEGLSIQDRFRPEPLYKTTGKGHYKSRTVEDIQSARKQSQGSRK